MSAILAIPAPRPLCLHIRDVCTADCQACYMFNRADRTTTDKEIRIDPIDIYRHWELITHVTAALHRRTPWIMVAPFLESKGFFLDNTSLIKGEVEEDDSRRVFMELVDTNTLIQPATDSRGLKVFIKSLAVNISFCPELHVWHKLASQSAMLDSRNHTVPVIEFLNCNPIFPDRPRDPMDLREFVVTPKLNPFNSSEPSRTPRFIFPDIRATLDYFYQVSEGFEYMHSCGIAHGDIAERNLIFSEMANGTRRYYIIDFGLSSIHDYRSREPPRVRASMILANSGPEQSMDVPYDPFFNDMYAIGMLFDDCINMTGSVSGERCWNNVPRITELIDSLFATKPQDRPTARAVLKTVRRLQRSLPEEILNIRLQYLGPFREFPHDQFRHHQYKYI